MFRSPRPHHQIRSIAGFTFFETRYEASLRLPQHSHDHACICVVVAGDFQEDFHRRKLQLRRRSVAFWPAAEMHEDRFGSSGPHRLARTVRAGFREFFRDDDIQNGDHE